MRRTLPDSRRRSILALAAAGAAALAGCAGRPTRHDGHGYRIPADFEPLGAAWLGWDPGHEDLTAELVAALQPHVRLKMLVRSLPAAEEVRSALRRRALPFDAIEFFVEPQAIYFVRDAAVFMSDAEGRVGVVDFRWNQYGLSGWCSGLDAVDPAVSARCVHAGEHARDGLDRALAGHIGGSFVPSPLVVEGGGFESNGRGLVIANEALYRQRNPTLARSAIEAELLRLPGVRKVVWLPEGLAEDPLHRATITGAYVGFGTGGHTDEFVRFVDPRTVMLAWPDDEDAAAHPVARIDRERMQRNLEALQRATDADGQHLRVVKLPMPRPVERRIRLADQPERNAARTWAAGYFPPAERRRHGDELIQVASASYLNFVVANGVVLLPDYLPHGTPWQRQARVRELFAAAFPGRLIRFVDAIGANWVGGGLHCAVLPEPSGGA